MSLGETEVDEGATAAGRNGTAAGRDADPFASDRHAKESGPAATMIDSRAASDPSRVRTVRLCSEPEPYPAVFVDFS